MAIQIIVLSFKDVNKRVMAVCLSLISGALFPKRGDFHHRHTTVLKTKILLAVSHLSFISKVSFFRSKNWDAH